MGPKPTVRVPYQASSKRNWLCSPWTSTTIDRASGQHCIHGNSKHRPLSWWIQKVAKTSTCITGRLADIQDVFQRSIQRLDNWTKAHRRKCVWISKCSTPRAKLRKWNHRSYCKFGNSNRLWSCNNCKVNQNKHTPHQRIKKHPTETHRGIRKDSADVWKSPTLCTSHSQNRQREPSSPPWPSLLLDSRLFMQAYQWPLPSPRYRPPEVCNCKKTIGRNQDQTEQMGKMCCPYQKLTYCGIMETCL